MLGYAFITLSPTQLEERRRQLDRAGFHAWLSPVILLLAIYIYRRFLEPMLSGTILTRAISSHKSSRGHLLLVRTKWVLSTPYIPEFGPLHIQLLGAIYTLWLLYLATRNTGNDYVSRSIPV